MSYTIQLETVMKDKINISDFEFFRMLPDKNALIGGRCTIDTLDRLAAFVHRAFQHRLSCPSID